MKEIRSIKFGNENRLHDCISQIHKRKKLENKKYVNSVGTNLWNTLEE